MDISHISHIRIMRVPLVIYLTALYYLSYLCAVLLIFPYRDREIMRAHDLMMDEKFLQGIKLTFGFGGSRNLCCLPVTLKEVIYIKTKRA